MKIILIIAVLILVACESLKGPQGPMGLTGLKGESEQTISMTTGFLTLDKYNDSLQRWELEIYDKYDSTYSGYIVNLFLRANQNQYWLIPEWFDRSWGAVHYVDTLSIMISDYSKTLAGYEYKVTIAKE